MGAVSRFPRLLHRSPLMFSTTLMIIQATTSTSNCIMVHKGIHLLDNRQDATTTIRCARKASQTGCCFSAPNAAADAQARRHLARAQRQLRRAVQRRASCDCHFLGRAYTFLTESLSPRTQD
ncbi:hypothetical protein PHLGIDRAFT_281108 [Phlebiopsis gigantea 11061_1 CR5-6]|uniref:Uncharacterized protein n=1 Tax=Phlebiopsis gigantea (strain 11061_1 CR5-6) TaxID=745531 RepID=A0A0C3SBG4_PHLG1|nr:hypothetical protein PHLGIDRAFT_281108 [Phlebiopsis gigantea 11061_1 CR5-6]